MTNYTGVKVPLLIGPARGSTIAQYTDGRRHDEGSNKSPSKLLVKSGSYAFVETVDNENFPAVISGGVSEIIYNFVETDPFSLNVGSVLEDTQYGFILYNRFLHETSVQIATIVISDNAVTLDGLGVGNTINRLSSDPQLITIPGEGDDEISFTVTWTFTNGASTVLQVTGVRTSTQTAIPNFPLIEKLSYLSRIATTYNTEFRGVVRQHPRVMAKYNWNLDGAEATRFLSTLRNGEKDHFSFPMWRQSLPITNLIAGTTVLPYGRNDWDVQVNDSLFLYNRKASDEVVTVTQVADTTTTITPLTIPVTDSAWAIPMITGFLREKPNVSYKANGVVDVSLEVETATFYKWDAVAITTFTDAGWSLLNGYLIWPFLNRVFSGIDAGSLTRRVFNDHGSGNIEMILMSSEVRDYYTLNYTAKNTSELTLLKRFTYYMRGKVGAFYMPTHRPDIVIGTLTVDNGSTIITADGLNGVDNYVGTTGIQFQFTDGTVHNAIATFTNQNDISFTPALDRAIVVADDIQMVCLMNLVRFNTDDIDIEHESPNKSTVSIPLVNVI